MKLGIYGAGGLGREVYVLAQQINHAAARWDEIFFIDDVTEELQVMGAKVVRYDDCPADCEVIIGIGEPVLREKLAHKVSAARPLATLIHPDVFIPDNSQIGAGAIIFTGNFISCNVAIGDNVLIQSHASVAHDCRVGMHSVICSMVSLAGACTVRERAFIGMNCCVKEKTRIGEDSILGMGAVVIRDVAAATIVVGNPAEVLSKNTRGRVFR